MEEPRRPSIDLVARLLARGAEEDPKVTKNALVLLSELTRLLVAAARARGEAEARLEGDEIIFPVHLETILPELLADFS